VDNRSEMRDFLTSRRARLTLEQVGLHDYASARRVKGLRREEVALLSGVSVDYYTRLERGTASGVSDSVLDSVCRALQLNEAERAHLYDLARATSRVRRPASRNRVRPTVQRMLDAMTTAPAYVRNGSFDVLAHNRLAEALLPYLTTGDGRTPNTARYLFLDPASHDFYVEWQTVARDLVASLRSEAGRTPYDRGVTDLVGELSTLSEPFRAWWAAHDVRLHRSATKLMHHPLFGDIQVSGEALAISADPDLTMIVYTAEPGSPSAEALSFLASWASSPDSATQTATDRAEQGDPK
jgi:transcriptional regulator with XRE-family HTH domain